ncbi:extracellular solute-binding protein [Microbacterium hydrocarbonoxydans]|uniref:extracellular solute-binding protein n=1 Tax=Microbacterium hydrocarbonoxydans TaxID=273678 RepID=UPI0007BB0F39|nr:extracellular solute-binding protein [Microbacterium hydrocarbonoxydans]GAT74804.1 ABC transporter substrate-binding protein [Microbacterium sp. HM58-2]
MPIRRITTLGALATATALLLAGCASGDAGDAGGSGGGGETGPLSAVMYSSNNETVIGVVTDAASAHDPALKVDAVAGSSGPLLQRIESEAAEPAADVFYSAPAAVLEPYADFIEPYRSPEADAIPEELVDPEERWTATNTHVVALMVNTDQIEGGEPPTTWQELTEPEWKGKIISADPAQSSTALTALYGAYKVLGEEDFAKLAANLEITESSSNVYPAVAQGEYAVSIGYESNIYPYVAGGQAGIEMVYPEDGTFVEHDAVLIVKGGPNPEGAKALVDVILAKETQEENLAQSFRRPSREDIDVTEFVEFTPLDDLEIVDIHGEEDVQGRQDFLSYWSAL